MEYVNIKFYREFGWTPDELRRQKSKDIMDILTIWDVEAKVKKPRDK